MDKFNAEGHPVIGREVTDILLVASSYMGWSQLDGDFIFPHINWVKFLKYITDHPLTLLPIFKEVVFIAELQRNGRQAEPHNYRNRITCMHRNRNPCNSFLMVKMASDMDHGRVGPTTTMTMNNIAQHGGHPANTKFCSLRIQRIPLIFDIHMKFNWQL